MKPNVIVAGFLRCATTYLYAILKQHPEISVSNKKEINFFNLKPYFLSHPEIPNPRIFSSKEQYFNCFKENKVIIDFAIMSSYDSNSIYKIKSMMGDVKIIFITRDKTGHKNSIRNLIKIHKGNVNDYQKYSEFDKYIKPYKKNFSKVYVTSLEEIKNKKGINNLLNFLEVNKKIKLNYDVPKHTKEELKKSFTFLDNLKRNFYFYICKLINKSNNFK